MTPEKHSPRRPVLSLILLLGGQAIGCIAEGSIPANGNESTWSGIVEELARFFANVSNRGAKPVKIPLIDDLAGEKLPGYRLFQQRS